MIFSEECLICHEHGSMVFAYIHQYTMLVFWWDLYELAYIIYTRHGHTTRKH